MKSAPLESMPGLDGDDRKTKTVTVGVHHRCEDGTTFVVLSGRAMVEFDDEDSLVFLRRGSLCQLAPNTQTRWTVSERLEYLVVTQACLVFKEHDDEPAPVAADVDQAHPVRPFRPRRHVS